MDKIKYSNEENINIKKAKNIIFNQISTEIILGHNAIAVYVALSDHSHSLNTLPFHQVLGAIQQHALAAFILSLGKLYEKPNCRYPNFSIPTTICMLKENLSGIIIGVQKGVWLEQFIKARIDATFTVAVPNNVSRIPCLMLNYFEEQCPQISKRKGKELDFALDALKVLRDKRVAHDEDTDLSQLRKTNLDGIRKLLAFARTYVNTIGYGFFGFSKEGEVGIDRFDPHKSVLWPGLNRMIELLK